jgi:hypothetical protein
MSLTECPHKCWETVIKHPFGYTERIIKEGRWCHLCNRWCEDCVNVWAGNRHSEIMQYQEFLFHVAQQNLYESFTMNTYFKTILHNSDNFGLTVAEECIRIMFNENWTRNSSVRNFIPLLACEMIDKYDAKLTEKTKNQLTWWVTHDWYTPCWKMTIEQEKSFIRAGWVKPSIEPEVKLQKLI